MTHMVDDCYSSFFRNGQRPGAITGMMMEEWEEGVRMSTAGYLCVHVNEHKGQKPAKIVASGQLGTQLCEWVELLRPLHVPDGCEYVFAGENGDRLQNLSRAVTTLAKKFDMNIRKATDVRKAIATKGGDFSDKEKSSLAHAMSHTTSTADRYYRAYAESKNMKGYDVIGSILEVPKNEEKKRRRFTEEQTKLIKEHFHEKITSKEMPTPPDLEMFLSQHRQVFQGRVRGDIYSKIRNIIGRK